METDDFMSHDKQVFLPLILVFSIQKFSIHKFAQITVLFLEMEKVLGEGERVQGKKVKFLNVKNVLYDKFINPKMLMMRTSSGQSEYP